MKTNILATAIALSDRDLLARIHTLACTEREAAAELLAHLTALELRPSLYAAQGYGSLFEYCTRALGLSEDAACSRINVVRASTRFPIILDHLFSGALTLTSVRLLAPHLTAENHEAVLSRAKNKRREEIEALVAELAPRPDVPASVRKLPVPKAAACPVRTDAACHLSTAPIPTDPPPEAANVSSRDHSPRPIVQALAPLRYRVQFTIGQEAHDDLRTVQALLRREIPSGDPGAIFTRALALLRKEVEKAKLGVVAKPRRTGGVRPKVAAYENRIRFRTDKTDTPESAPPRDIPRIETALIRQEPRPSRHIPNAVKRVVWYRDRGQCAFVSATGRRCFERNFLELHHIQPHALDGPATVGNISLRCRRHNQYESEVSFGRRNRSSSNESAGGEKSHLSNREWFSRAAD